jgi:hypothetical protein
VQRILSLALIAVGAISSAGPAAAQPPTPIVLTLDGLSYVTYVAPVAISPADKLILAPESRMDNCRRSSGMPLPQGVWSLVYSGAGDAVNAVTMNIRFAPTRIVLTSLFGDVVCDGVAGAGETGLGRLFRDSFEL